jgi:hypothetical protein
MAMSKSTQSKTLKAKTGQRARLDVERSDARRSAAS